MFRSKINTKIMILKKKNWFILALSLLFWNSLIIFDLYTSKELLTYYSTIILGIYLYFQNKEIENEIKINKIKLYSSFFIIFFILIKGARATSELDLFIYLSTPILLISMIILINGVKRINSYFDILLFSFLMPLRPLIIKFLNIFLLPITTFITWVNLNLLGLNMNLSDNIIYKNGSGIIIEKGCSGASSIVFGFTIALLILIIFPLNSRRSIAIFFLTSIILSFIENIVRLSLLAYLASINSKNSMMLLDFFHQSYGSLIFNAVTSILIFYSYSNILNIFENKNYENKF